MFSRLVSLCPLVLSIPVLSQQQDMGAQGQPWVWGRGKTMNPDPIPSSMPKLSGARPFTMMRKNCRH